jgi:enterochelin esterase family protein
MKLKIGILLLFGVSCLYAQEYSSFTNTLLQLQFGDSSTRETVWSRLKTNNQIPLISNDSVAFLFKGKANSVAWMGDFNAWGYDKSLNVHGTRYGNNLWILRLSFPTDARLDYKILVNGIEWLLDSNNPYQQWSGVGGGSPNSELRMPNWKEDEVQIKHRKDGGALTEDILFFSNELGYQIMYKVYTPPHYEKHSSLPILYVTDGYEYLHPKMGNMTAVLDNLILENKIEPIIAVFVDHREPVNRSNNKRMTELTLNPKYLNFFIEELIPHAEKKLKVSGAATTRGIMGANIGGLNAAYFAFTRPDVFGISAIQSPSFYTQPQIYKICDTPESPKIKVYMSSGVMNDASPSTRKMKAIMETNACVYTYQEVNQGHSWGNWRNLIDDILTYFFAPQ